MMIVGRILNKVDPRGLIILGMLTTAFSLWQMTRFSTFVPRDLIVISGVIQGMGLGLIFVPLNTIAFATLAASLRTEAAGLYSLIRNLGSSLGVSIVIALLARNLQINHSYIGENITPYNTGVITQYAATILGSANSGAIMAFLNGEITKQAATISYIDDFKLMMLINLASIPFVFLLRAPKKQEPEPAMIME